MKHPSPESARATFTDYLKSWPLYFLPHHLISRLIFRLSRLSSGSSLVIPWFIKKFNVDMSESAEQNIENFATFNAFFTRELKCGARPVTQHCEHIACPADGAVSATGKIRQGRIFQAKGQHYTLRELLGDDATNSVLFDQGMFATIYLSPRDYHRVHMPVTGRLLSQTYIPGRLFSVAPHTARTVPRLFARNERLVCYFDTPVGTMAIILVGAINVAAIETVWDGLVTPPAGRKIISVEYTKKKSVVLNRGDEMGRFNMGSTVIVLFERQVGWHHSLRPGSSVKMGQHMADSPSPGSSVILC